MLRVPFTRSPAHSDAWVGTDMDQSEVGTQVENRSVEEGSWWQQFAARFEATQHLGSHFRQYLIALLGRSRTLNEVQMRDVWVALGFFEDAWAVDRGAGASVEREGPGLGNRGVVPYALWILGRSPCPSPSDVLAHDRDDVCRWLIGWAFRLDLELLATLVEIVRDAHDVERCRATELILWAGMEGWPPSTQAIAEILANKDDPMRPHVLVPLSWAAFRGRFREAAGTLAGIAADVTDPLRSIAIQYLIWGGADRDGSVLEVVASLCRDGAHPAQCVAIWSLVTCVKRHPESIVGLLGPIAKNPDDPNQGAAVWVLAHAAHDGIQEAARVLDLDVSTELPYRYVLPLKRLGLSQEGEPIRDVVEWALDRTHPSRGAALWAMRFHAREGRREALQTLCVVAGDPSDPCRDIALWGLHWAAEDGHVEAVRALSSIACTKHDPARYVAIYALKHTPMERLSAAVRAMAQIVGDTHDPARFAAWWLLGRWSASIMDDSLDSIARVASNATDPLSDEAVSVIGSSALFGNQRAIGALTTLVRQTSGPQRDRARAVLARVASLPIPRPVEGM